MSASEPTVGFDPDLVASHEANCWRAYYDRNWLRLLRLLGSVAEQEFHIPRPLSWVAAYYIVRASIAWVPVDHDERTVLRYYASFYRLARRYSGLQFDPVRVAELELRYNDVHRRLVGNPDKRSSWKPWWRSTARCSALLPTRLGRRPNTGWRRPTQSTAFPAEPRLTWRLTGSRSRSSSAAATGRSRRSSPPDPPTMRSRMPPRCA